MFQSTVSFLLFIKVAGVTELLNPCYLFNLNTKYSCSVPSDSSFTRQVYAVGVDSSSLQGKDLLVLTEPASDLVYLLQSVLGKALNGGKYSNSLFSERGFFGGKGLVVYVQAIKSGIHKESGTQSFLGDISINAEIALLSMLHVGALTVLFRRQTSVFSELTY